MRYEKRKTAGLVARSSAQATERRSPAGSTTHAARAATAYDSELGYEPILSVAEGLSTNPAGYSSCDDLPGVGGRPPATVVAAETRLLRRLNAEGSLNPAS